MGKFMRGLFAGGALGAIAALLLAPQKGEEVRKKLGEAADSFSERFKEVSDEVKQKVDQLRDMAAGDEEDNDEAKFT